MNGSLFLLENMFISKSFCRKKIINSIIKTYYFSDHDAVKLKIRSEFRNNIQDNIEFSIV